MKILEILCLAFLMISDCVGCRKEGAMPTPHGANETTSSLGVFYEGGEMSNPTNERLSVMATQIFQFGFGEEGHTFTYHDMANIDEYRGDSLREIQKTMNQIRSKISVQAEGVSAELCQPKVEKCIADLHESLENLVDAIVQFDLNEERYSLVRKKMQDVYDRERILYNETNNDSIYFDVKWCMRDMVYYCQRDGKTYSLMIDDTHELIYPFARWHSELPPDSILLDLKSTWYCVKSRIKRFCENLKNSVLGFSDD